MILKSILLILMLSSVACTNSLNPSNQNSDLGKQSAPETPGDEVPSLDPDAVSLLMDDVFSKINLLRVNLHNSFGNEFESCPTETVVFAGEQEGYGSSLLRTVGSSCGFNHASLVVRNEEEGKSHQFLSFDSIVLDEGFRDRLNISSVKAETTRDYLYVQDSKDHNLSVKLDNLIQLNDGRLIRIMKNSDVTWLKGELIETSAVELAIDEMSILGMAYIRRPSLDEGTPTENKYFIQGQEVEKELFNKYFGNIVQDSYR